MFSFSSTFWTSNHAVEAPVASSSRISIEDSVQVHVHTATERDSDSLPSPATPQSCESPTSPITPPPAAYYSPTQIQESMMVEFFGGRPTRTRTRDTAPPAYSQEGECEKLPSYCECAPEPVTLARYLFIYGFFFPVFWVVGIAILFSPLRATPDWEMGKTEDEKKQLLSEMRAAEVKWAQRCLLATLTLLFAIAILVLIVIFAK